MNALLICGVGLLVLSGPALVSGLITVDDQCRSDQSCVFYGALGRPLYLQLPDEHELRLKNISSETPSKDLFLYRNQKIRVNHLDPRWQFNTENKTMIITRAEKEDSGRYKLDSFNSTGNPTDPYYLHLIIEAVVSSVKVTSSCIFITTRKVHCESDGDDIEFSWTRDGIPQNQNLTDGNQILLLDEGFTGSVTCHVENHVSNGSATVNIEPCTEPTTAAPTTTTTSPTTNATSLFNDLALIMLGLFAVLLIVVVVIACHIYRKKQAPKTTGSPQNGEELLYVQVNHKPKPKPKDGEEGTSRPVRVQEEEVEYASVVRQPKQKKKKKKEEPKEEEVQYGEVVFKTPAKQRSEQPEEECVYSQVHHKR